MTARAAAFLLVGLIGLGACGTTRDPAQDVAAGPRASLVEPRSVSVEGSSTGSYGLSEILADLHNGGFPPRLMTGTSANAPLLGVTKFACVAGEQVQIYQYSSEVRRQQVAAGISPEGSSINTGSAMVNVSWISTPHFYGRGRVIVLYLGNNKLLTNALSSLMGKTLTPKAFTSAHSGDAC